MGARLTALPSDDGLTYRMHLAVLESTKLAQSGRKWLIGKGLHHLTMVGNRFGAAQ